MSELEGRGRPALDTKGDPSQAPSSAGPHRDQRCSADPASRPRFELAVEFRESRGCDADPLPASCEATLVALLPGGGSGALTLTQDMSRDALELHVGDFASVEISGQLEGREQHHLNIDGVEFYLPTGRVTVPGFFAGPLRIWVSRRGNFMGYLGQTDVRAVAGQTVEAKVVLVDEWSP